MLHMVCLGLLLKVVQIKAGGVKGAARGVITGLDTEGTVD